MITQRPCRGGRSRGQWARSSSSRAVLDDEHAQREPAGQDRQLELVPEQRDHDEGRAERDYDGEIEEVEVPAADPLAEPREEREAEERVDDELVDAQRHQGRVALGSRAGARERRLGREPDIEAVTSRGPRHAHLEGFDLHANVWVSANDRAGLERLCRDVAAACA